MLFNVIVFCVPLAVVCTRHWPPPQTVDWSRASGARDHGAVGNGFADDTHAIQATIDAAASIYETEGSPAYAVLSSGIFLTGSIFLKTGVILFIDRTAILKASTNASLFPRDPDWPYQGALIVATTIKWSAVMGGGVIDGQAPQFVTSLDPVTDQFRFDTYNNPGCPSCGHFRVRTIDYRHSTDIVVSGITIEGWYVHVMQSQSEMIILHFLHTPTPTTLRICTHIYSHIFSQIRTPTQRHKTKQKLYRIELTFQLHMKTQRASMCTC